MIKQKHLSNHVVVLAWSMGGNVEAAVGEAFQKAGVNLDSFIGLSAVTPLSYLGQKIKGANGDDMLPNHLLNAKPFFNFFGKLLDEQSTYNDHEIIPKQVYLNEFIGNLPVALEAQGYHFEGDKFVFNLQKTLDDSGVFHFEHTPWIGLISDDSSSIPRITLIDLSAWHFIRNEMLYVQYLTRIAQNQDPHGFAKIKRLLAQIDRLLTKTVHGNHFFFVGKKGARETAEKVEILMQEIQDMKRNMPRPSLPKQVDSNLYRLLK